MATSVISCSGATQPWQTENPETEDPTDPTCPQCGLTAKDLGLKVTRRGTKLNPATIPTHHIEVEGQELKFHLGTDGLFHVHTMTCAGLKREMGPDGSKSNYEKPMTLVAVDRRDAVMDLWSDQIAENQDIADPENPTDDELSGYYQETDFHRCVAKLDGFTAATAAGKNGVIRRDAKRMLATLLVEAMAKALDEIADTNLASTAEEDADAQFVLSGLSNIEIRRVTAQWIHHFPADRDRWVKSGMTIPARSDWADFVDSQTENETDNEED